MKPLPATGGRTPQGPPTGVLLVNVGSPREPTPRAVRRYLAEFLADPDVVDLPRWVWLPLLRGVILPLRSPRSAEMYASIWSPGGSPLIEISKRQRDALERELEPSFRVGLGMRYGEPSIGAALAELAAAGCGRVLLVPLFPQWSRSTSGSVEKAARAALETIAPAPDLIDVGAWPVDPGYVDAVAERVREAAGGGAIDHTVLSFHGLPASSVERGDPYRDQCAATARALADRLGLAGDRWTLAFQSRFGPAKWLEPYTKDVLRDLAPRCRRVLVVCPGFAADCLETLEEIGVRLAATFREAGGSELVIAPCLNDSPRWIRALGEIVRRAARSPASSGLG